MEKREIKETAKRLILEGKPKQEVLEELLESTEMPEKKLANIIKLIPTKELRKKYKYINSFLAIFLLGTGILKLIGGLPMLDQVGWFILVLPLLNIVLTIAVFKFNGGVYKTIALFGFISLINLTKEFGKETNELQIALQIGIIAVFIALGLFLNSKLNSKLETRKAWKVNENGKKEMIDKIYFA